MPDALARSDPRQLSLGDCPLSQQRLAAVLATKRSFLTPVENRLGFRNQTASGSGEPRRQWSRRPFPVSSTEGMIANKKRKVKPVATGLLTEGPWGSRVPRYVGAASRSRFGSWDWLSYRPAIDDADRSHNLVCASWVDRSASHAAGISCIPSGRRDIHARSRR